MFGPILFGALATLAGCNASGGGDALKSAQNNTPQPATPETTDLRAYCPKTVLRAGTETYRTFEAGVKRDDPDSLNSLRFQATITEVVRECNYTAANLNMRVGIAGRLINGPTGASGTVDMPVRVAVTNTANEVLYSQLHQIPATLAPGSSNASFRYVDSQINLPIPAKQNLLVYVGFDEGPYDTQ